MNIKKVNIVFKFFIICLFALFLVSTVSANDEVVNTNFSDGNSYIVTSDLSNDEIQSMFDNANNGDTLQYIANEPLALQNYPDHEARPRELLQT